MRLVDGKRSMEIQLGYEDEYGSRKGLLSSIYGISLKDNPDNVYAPSSFIEEEQKKDSNSFRDNEDLKEDDTWSEKKTEKEEEKKEKRKINQIKYFLQ